MVFRYFSLAAHSSFDWDTSLHRPDPEASSGTVWSLNWSTWRGDRHGGCSQVFGTRTTRPSANPRTSEIVYPSRPTLLWGLTLPLRCLKEEFDAKKRNSNTEAIRAKNSSKLALAIRIPSKSNFSVAASVAWRSCMIFLSCFHAPSLSLFAGSNFEVKLESMTKFSSQSYCYVQFRIQSTQWGIYGIKSKFIMTAINLITLWTNNCLLNEFLNHAYCLHNVTYTHIYWLLYIRYKYL